MSIRSLHANPFVSPGEVITTESGFLWGHGTKLGEEDKQLRATVAGFVEQVNKLLTVRPLTQRYAGDIGDVVIGRVTQVGDKRWKVDINSRQDGILMLSSIHLPGGVQRRRTQEDSLQMREFFEEGDLISAEVQNFYHDGAVALHTRSSKYGKLNRGQFVVVRQALVKRCKQHFVTLPDCNVDIILGNNGYIWITESSDGSGAGESAERRQQMARVRQSIVALDRMFVAIFPDSVMDVYHDSIDLGVSPADITHRDYIHRVTQKAVLRLQQV
ncbi:S1 motif domain-containing protein [Plasmodiophora brassicae]|nr:hypothetical protein PBRA_000899 [Plasmodiophora brassicae]